MGDGGGGGGCGAAGAVADLFSHGGVVQDLVDVWPAVYVLLEALHDQKAQSSRQRLRQRGGFLSDDFPAQGGRQMTQSIPMQRQQHSSPAPTPQSAEATA